MPIFNAHTSDLQATGPVIDLRLAISSAAAEAMRRGGEKVPAPVDIRALIDTGASRSILKDEIIEKLGLLPVGALRMDTTALTGLPCYEYLLEGAFHGLTFAGVFIGAPLRNQEIQALIGRDILSHFVLTYSGPDNSFSLYC